LGNIAAAGYRAEEIDEICFTHLHTDHVGGLMHDGRCAFPNAIVRLDKREADYWLSETHMNAAPAEARRFFLAAMASLNPYMAAAKVEPFEGDTDLGPGFRARSAPGHTPGHTMYMIESRDQKLLLWGDVVHVGAVQFTDPSVTIDYDVDR